MKYCLKTDPLNRDKVERVLQVHADYCPVARSIKDSIEITTEVEFQDVG